MQRHMAFDFANTGHAATDAAAKGLSDQYMFGPALLVAPIVSDGLSRPVFLPFLSSGAGWTNFYTGETVTGVGNLDVETNLTTIPLFASAGSILLLVRTSPFSFSSDLPCILYLDNSLLQNMHQNMIAILFDLIFGPFEPLKGSRSTIHRRKGRRPH